jgi:ABC transporter transmembrane region
MSAIISGVLTPAVSIVMGDILTVFNPSSAESELLNQMSNLTIYISIVGAIQWFFCYAMFAFWQHLAENISYDLRSKYLRALLT